MLPSGAVSFISAFCESENVLGIYLKKICRLTSLCISAGRLLLLLVRNSDFMCDYQIFEKQQLTDHRGKKLEEALPFLLSSYLSPPLCPPLHPDMTTALSFPIFLSLSILLSVQLPKLTCASLQERGSWRQKNTTAKKRGPLQYKVQQSLRYRILLQDRENYRETNSNPKCYSKKRRSVQTCTFFKYSVSQFQI
jgi:hypothetical protein